MGNDLCAALCCEDPLDSPQQQPQYPPQAQQPNTEYYSPEEAQWQQQQQQRQWQQQQQQQQRQQQYAYQPQRQEPTRAQQPQWPPRQGQPVPNSAPQSQNRPQRYTNPTYQYSPPPYQYPRSQPPQRPAAPPRPSQYQYEHPSQYQRPEYRRQQRHHHRHRQDDDMIRGQERCDVCGIHLDTALMSGHRESCRANHRRWMQQQVERALNARAQRTADPVSGSSAANPAATTNNTTAAATPARTTAAATPDTVDEDYRFAIHEVIRDFLSNHARRFADSMAPSATNDAANNPVTSEVPYYGAPNPPTPAVPNNAGTGATKLATNDMEDDELCVVCLDKPRDHAFIPCGHIVCCYDCATKLSCCPLCREPRQGLCYVANDVLSHYLCKHCHAFIMPSLFDGHIEVCALQQRQRKQQQQQELLEEQQRSVTSEALINDETALKTDEVDDDDEISEKNYTFGEAVAEQGVDIDIPGASPPSAPNTTTDKDTTTPTTTTAAAANGPTGTTTTTPTPTPAAATTTQGDTPAATSTAQAMESGATTVVPRNICVDCRRSVNKLVICLPCGHRVLCADCAKRLTSCPVCLRDIDKALLSFA